MCRDCLLLPVTGDAGLPHCTAPHVSPGHTPIHTTIHTDTLTHGHTHTHTVSPSVPCAFQQQSLTPVPARTASPSGSRVCWGIPLAWMRPGCVPQPWGDSWSPWVFTHVRGTTSDIGSRHERHRAEASTCGDTRRGPRSPVSVAERRVTWHGRVALPPWAGRPLAWG